MNIGKIYENYGSYLVEQGTISDDLDARLVQYLEVDEIRKAVTDLVNSTKDGDSDNTEMTKKDNKFIQEGDILQIEVDKTDKDDPKVTASIKNIEKTSSNIDFNTASYFVHKAISGIGTDEELVAAVGTAISKLSYEDGLDGSEYFDKLADAYTSKYGETLTDALEGDFSGNAEVVALSIYRREIEESVMRGIDIENIIADIGLSIGTLGAGHIFKGAKTIGTASKNIAKATAKGAKPLTKGIKGMVSRLPGFKSLNKAKKLSAIKSNVKVGDTVSSVTKKGVNAGKSQKYVIKEINDKGIVGNLVDKSGKVNPLPIRKNFGEFVSEVNPKLANKILTSAGVEPNLALAGLAGKKLAEVNGTSNTENFAEIMGWYSTVTADPEAFMDTIRGEEMSSLAQRMHDLSDGVTTMGDELSMALIVTSLSPGNIKKLNDEYAKLSTDDNTMLDDLQYESSYFGSIDSDVTDLISIYVKGFLGNEPQVNNIYNKIKK